MVPAGSVSKRVTFATTGNDALLWKAFATELLRHNGNLKAIRHVAIDMSAAYTGGVNDNFGNARIVDNKFQILNDLVEACD